MLLNPDELTRYTQQIKLPEVGVNGQLQLKNARVLCIGAGGLGSPLLLYLAALGIGTLGIVDHDQVELSNLQRQILYQTQHIGQPKVVVAQQQLTALNRHIAINTYPVRLTKNNAATILSEYDIIADCSDNFATRYLVNDVCRVLAKPLIAAAIQQFAGQCMTFLPRSACLRCIFPLEPAANCVTNCAEGGVLGLLPAWFGTMQAMEIINIILQLRSIENSKMILFDMLTYSFREWQLSRDSACFFCKSTPVTPAARKNNLTISSEELKQELQEQTILLLDVRTAAEHEAYNIGGTLLTLDDMPKHLPQVDKHHPIVCYCQSGARSQFAVQILLNAGFINVRSLENGVVNFIA